MEVGRSAVQYHDDDDRKRISALTMYPTPPDEPISVTEFEDFALDRLRLLGRIDMSRAKGKKGQELDAVIQKARNELMPLSQAGLRKDRISHFILRLAYCRTEDLRRWFLQNELELFKWRFQHNPPENLSAWLASNNLKYEAISREEANAFAQELKEAADCRREKHEGGKLQEHYKVPFEEVVDLIRQRRVFVRAGFAYVPHTDLVSIVATRVRAHLSKQLSIHARQWPALREEEAERLSGFLEGLATSYVGEVDFGGEGKGSGMKVSLAELPMLSRRSMPLCMSNMFTKLTDTHHLKHKARNQLGLFLKGIGLTVEESIQIWKTSFLKDPGMTSEKFDKEYRYGIRYNYGLEGKRTDWSAHSCMRIIMETGTNPSAGEHHGCPFKTFDEPQLRAQLQQMGVGTADANYIFDKVRNQHFQVACGKYFEAKHKGNSFIDDGISHPNEYFKESLKFYAPKEGAEGSAGASAGAPPVIEAGAAAEAAAILAAN